jgi:formylglycine-generating enzyme required for sulfatase activity
MGKILILNLAMISFLPFIALAQNQSQMIRIDGGSFLVVDEHGKERNRITVSTFLMAKYVVTNAEWAPFRKEFSKKIGGQSAGNAFYPSEISPDPAMPTFGMTWYAAVAYCNWKSAKEGLTSVYTIQGDWDRNKLFESPPVVSANWSANGYRLPTLAEWMFVYKERGAGKTKYPGSNKLDDVAFILDRSASTIKLAPVGSKKPSAQGVYDLVGNVPQWCWDFFARDYLNTAPTNNPHGPTEVPFDKTIFDSTPGKAGGNLDTSYYKTARVIAGISFGGTDKSELVEEGAGVRNKLVGIRLVRNAE